MPKKEVSDLITDQEMTFARLILSGTMNDRDAAQAAGLKPDTAAYTKAKPRVRAYMVEHRAAVEQKLVQQQAEAQHQQNQARIEVLARLWEVARMSPDMTRNSITGQVKALCMIVAIEGLIPDRRANSAQNDPAPAIPTAPPFYRAKWLREQEEQEQSLDPQLNPQKEDEPAPAGTTVNPSEPSAAPVSDAADTRVSFWMKNNPPARRR